MLTGVSLQGEGTLTPIRRLSREVDTRLQPCAPLRARCLSSTSRTTGWKSRHLGSRQHWFKAFHRAPSLDSPLRPATPLHTIHCLPLVLVDVQDDLDAVGGGASLKQEKSVQYHLHTNPCP